MKEYLLSRDHPRGRQKAKAFAGAGYTLADARTLRAVLLQLAITGDVVETTEDEYGIKYVIDGEIPARSPEGLTIRTVWMIDHGSQRPRLITAYPRRRSTNT